ncbi:MAG TPA: nucleoside triphosphate pyrophosphohydrolase [Terracidiphilus sp.]|nr:nucleoside triphosphate pyrophosphohydrolase [Terracidiphilus sp.]
MDVARRAGSPGKDQSVPGMAKESDPTGAAELFERSVGIMARLRAPGGCPWDREQTFDTIRKYTLEEAYEVFDAIERRDFPHLAEELGDLLLQVLFYAEMAANEGQFTIADVLDGLNRKLIRRHPHVFGEEASRAAGNRADVDADVRGSANAVLRNWEEIKALERKSQATSESRLDSVMRALPALAEAGKIGGKAAKAGFDWPAWRDLLPKIQEEVAELEAEVERGDKVAMEAEVGDLLFTVVNLARHLGVDAEMALRGCNARFRARFREMELAARRPLEELQAVELEELWVAAKRKLEGKRDKGPRTIDGNVGSGSGEEQPQILRSAQDDNTLDASGSSSAQDDNTVTDGTVVEAEDRGRGEA